MTQTQQFMPGIRTIGHLLPPELSARGVGSPQMLHSVSRVSMAQGMLMARFAMSEGYAMKYLSDQADLHSLTVVELAERVIERVLAS